MKRQKRLFNIVGLGIIVLWLVMVGLLIKKVNFSEQNEQAGLATGGISHLDSAERDWMDIYLKGEKVGYSVNQINPVGEDYLVQDEIFLRLNLMGQRNSIYTVTRSVVDRGFFLKNFRFRMTSGVVTYQLSGRVEDGHLLLDVGEGKIRRSESIEISSPPVMGSGIGYFFKGRKLKVGQSFKFPVFDPSTMAQKEMIIQVKDRESIVINRIKYSAFRLEAEMWGHLMTFWIDEKGAVLQEKGFMGFTLIKSSAANAPRDIGGSGDNDFYALAAIDIKGTLKDVDRLRYLKLKMEGLDAAHFDTENLTGGRQRFHSGMLEIIKEKTPIKAAYTIPYSDHSMRMDSFLKPEFNIESDESAVIDTAREIAGDVKNPVTVARRLMTWVYRNVEKKPVVSVPSALEVLRTRVGDCNEHSVLLTAMLRASGIPARLCVGLVYLKGSFFYHAWTEGYVGEWVTMDATLNQLPADVTHVKMVQGGLEKQAEIIGLIGKLGLKVVDYRY